MGRGKFSRTALLVSALVFMMNSLPLSAQAKEHRLPRLIQTVTEQDIYEGMLALGFLITPVLDTGDCYRAYENVKDCVVRVQMGKAHGSGIVWEMTQERIVVATNRHVLEYWNDEDSYVYFPQGYYAGAAVLGVSGQHDVGFLVIDSECFTYAELERIRCARIDMGAYGRLRPGDGMFFVDSASGMEEARYFEAVAGDPYMYIEDFDAYMLYAHGFAKEGMSGGGTFDERGYLVGMLTGGTYQNETASVPLQDIIEAYDTIMQENLQENTG